MKFYLLAIVLMLPLIANAEIDIITKQSAHDVQQTMDRLEAKLKENDVQIFARIDHKLNAEEVGMTLGDSQLLIFGKPSAGTKIMLNDMAAGLDLPMKILVYTAPDGKTWLKYRNPQWLREDYALDDCVVIGKLETTLD
ncbi:MAG: DUF302 domain-containing protein, partial [Pseudomonadota bacterium]|nr:DUF302 domain-containing protein [Pseudomonadota bacterium]